MTTKQRRAGMTKVELCIVAVIILLLIGLLLPYIQQAREAERRSTTKNHLKQIGLALHNYHETHRCFPPGGVIREDDTAMQGWLTMILPFLDGSPYYSWIDLDKSWDNPYNGYVLNSSIPSYLIPGVDAHFTSSGFGLTHNQGNPNIFYRNSSVKLRQMKNGAAHNWMLGEVEGNFQPWGYPFNWRPLGTKLCNGPASYGRPAWHGGHLLLADGSVSFFSDETSPEILKSLASSPPVATQVQTIKPATIFQTGNYQWKRVALYSDPEGPNTYFANVMKKIGGNPLVIQVYVVKKETEPPRRKGGPAPHGLFRINSTTDVAQALGETSMSQETTPAQFQANVKTLQQMQKRLPKKDSTR
ncbi:MAG: DUF1559 domain-containing protein [Planctomycetes bacterium]|nr:DUF1559 domain-containing protein [Planctomycetota bacterium]MCH9727536.1 DUF1559 domain-containing protein [Planctomycetota bacterium]MCH9777484.1 DUF1559 domain-containing protein [Planctomycetota bacterium]MCH9791771.1 DUF1559 domain-containing protein [Planctomycetota bacterium]